MRIIKLNTINSTNDYLKNMFKEIPLNNLTTVVSDYQLKGKGQYRNRWHSEKGKNLLFSVLIKFENFLIKDQVYLNFAISLAIFEVLTDMLKNVKIKWPNDIMSRQSKICGILIENSVKHDKISHSIVGIGLNVNQENFPTELKKATSIKKILKKDVKLDELLQKILQQIKISITKIEKKQFKSLHNDYHLNLYRFEQPSMFKTNDNTLFLGKIIGVSEQGKLKLELLDETIKEFEVKEISFMD